MMSLAEKQYPRLPCRMLPWLVCATSALAADLTLFDFDHATDFARFQKTDALVTEVKAGTGLAMRMTTGTSKPWPGVTLPAPAGH